MMSVELDMYLIAICAVGLIFLILGLFRMKQLRDRRELENTASTPMNFIGCLSRKRDIVVALCSTR